MPIPSIAKINVCLIMERLLAALGETASLLKEVTCAAGQARLSLAMGVWQIIE